jgi:hypothetical protein
MAGALPLPGAQRVVAHLTFHSTDVDAAAAGSDALLKDLFEDRFMKGFPLPRGE